jgi:hypothetical protein
MKILDIPQSGRCGEYVSVRTRYGQTRRRYAVPRCKPSPAQLLHRSRFGRVRHLWGPLTLAQKATWNTDIQDTRSRTRLNKNYSLPGYLVFVKVNTIRVTQGLPPVLTQPKRETFPANPVGELVATNTGGVPDLKLSVPSTPATDIVVFGAAPRSAGVSFVNHFVILGRLPAAEAGYSHITKLYIDRFGLPPVGTRVFIRTRQMRDGWVDIPLQTDAIVPPA